MTDDRAEAHNRMLPPMRRLAPAAACVMLATLLVFLPCVDHGFLRWDDDENIVDNERFRGLGPDQLLWMFTTTHMGPYQPLSWLSYGLDYVAWGLDPYGYHLTNVVLHTLSAGLLVWLTALVWAAREPRAAVAAVEGGGANRTACRAPRLAYLAGVLAGLAWAIHPQRVESVAWVTERRDVLCGVFFLLCLIAYMKGHGVDDRTERRGRWLWFSRLACLLAILSKGTAVSLPVVLVALDVVPLGRLRGVVRSWLKPPQRGVLLEKGGYLVFSLLGVGMGLWGQWQGGALRPLDEVGPLQRVGIASYAAVFYLVKLLLPVGLSPMYARPEGVSLPSLRFGGAVILVVVVTLVLVRLRRRWAWPLVVWSAYLAMVLPVSGLVTIGHELVADRYSYLASMAAFVSLGVGVAWMWGRLRAGVSRVALGTVVGLVVLVWLMITRDLIDVWHDDVALWERAVAVDPQAGRAQTNLGGAYLHAGRLEDAVKALERSVALSPEDSKAQHNLGMAYLGLRQYERALACFERAIAADADYVLARRARGVTLTDLERHDEAIEELSRALDSTKTPDQVAAIREDLGDAHLARGDVKAAVEIYRGLIEAGRVTGGVYGSLAEGLLRLGRADEAADLLLRAPRGAAGSAEVRYALARVRARQGRLTEAFNELGAALRAKPELRARARFDELLEPLRDDRRFERVLTSTADVLP